MKPFKNVTFGIKSITNLWTRSMNHPITIIKFYYQPLHSIMENANWNIRSTIILEPDSELDSNLGLIQLQKATIQLRNTQLILIKFCP